ncbi:NAD(P)/FAD-dependent oxidoreductase [Gordonia westfalica]|uniref:NADH dehydrogenase n=1 Tax=Gordonia westfalica TaxID=158898 RepID=A0A1H2I9R9_9ACTN|nr:FAD-dependent oxidoreductase [Gordonia westfalica]SDU40882.1 NADH dehydrogenase [Gordonia westfalica]
MSITDTTREIPTVTRTRVVVLGAGYAGAMAANRLLRNPDVDVTVVNPQPFFVQRIRLHQFVSGTGDPQVAFDDVLADDIRVVVDTATRIDAGAARVHLASGAHLDYDHLVYAIGTRHRAPEIPGAAEHAWSVSDWAAAQRLRDHLATLDEGDPVVVVGGGLTGIEAAAELAERGFAVKLVCGGAIAPSVGPRARRATLRQLARLGVEVVEEGRATAVDPSRVLVDVDGVEQILPSAATVLTTGFVAPELAADSGLTTDEIGRLHTDDALTSVDDDRIVGAGDAVAVAGMYLRMSCQAAEPLGAQAADAVLARIAGDRPQKVDQAFAAQCTSIGRRAATLQFTKRDDSPARMVATGRLAATAKEIACRGTVWFIRHEAARPGSYRWARGGDLTTTTEPALS